MATEKAVATKGTEKVSYEEFFRKAIPALRNPEYKGCHAVYSGLNGAFAAYYGKDVNVREVTDKLVAEKKILRRPVKGGVIFYLPEDVKASTATADTALAKMGLK